MEKMTKNNDPVSQLLKCHLLTEAVLDSLIELALEPNGEAVLSAKLSYVQKVQIVSKSFLVENSYPLVPDFVVGSLRKLNKLRNRMAHQLEAKVSLGEVMELFGGVEYPMPFTPSDEKINYVIYQIYRKNLLLFSLHKKLPDFEFEDETLINKE